MSKGTLTDGDDDHRRRHRRRGRDIRRQDELEAERPAGARPPPTRSRPTAKDSEGRAAHENASFTTVSPANSFIGNFTPEDGSTVGVGMPVSINFDKAITNKAAVQKGDHGLLHQRPGGRLPLVQRQPHGLPPRGLLAGELHRHAEARARRCRGRRAVSTASSRRRSPSRSAATRSPIVDAKTKTMKVTQDGKVVKTIPISAGSPENKTYEGQMVISEKFKETRMNGATVGFTDDDGKGEYDIKDVPHAMRLTTSGTFIHGNYWGAEVHLRQRQHQPRLCRPVRHQGRQRPEHARAPGSTTTRSSVTSWTSGTPATRPSPRTTASTAGT